MPLKVHISANVVLAILTKMDRALLLFSHIISQRNAEIFYSLHTTFLYNFPSNQFYLLKKSISCRLLYLKREKNCIKINRLFR